MNNQFIKCEICNIILDINESNHLESIQYDHLCTDCYLAEIGEYEV